MVTEVPPPPLAPARPLRKPPRFVQRALCYHPRGVNTPLVLSFEPEGHVVLSAHPGRFAFEPGQPVHSAWPSPQTPWLVRDLDGDGRIASGRELLGSFTLIDGAHATNGFTALAALDENHDGVVDARDPAFASLALWRDDGDRLVQRGELVPLNQAGVSSLSTSAVAMHRCDGQGTCEVLRSPFSYLRAGVAQTGAIVDLTLTFAP